MGSLVGKSNFGRPGAARTCRFGNGWQAVFQSPFLAATSSCRADHAEHIPATKDLTERLAMERPWSFPPAAIKARTWE